MVKLNSETAAGGDPALTLGGAGGRPGVERPPFSPGTHYQPAAVNPPRPVAPRTDAAGADRIPMVDFSDLGRRFQPAIPPTENEETEENGS